MSKIASFGDIYDLIGYDYESYPRNYCPPYWLIMTLRQNVEQFKGLEVKGSYQTGQLVQLEDITYTKPITYYIIVKYSLPQTFNDCNVIAVCETRPTTHMQGAFTYVEDNVQEIYDGKYNWQSGSHQAYLHGGYSDYSKGFSSYPSSVQLDNGQGSPGRSVGIGATVYVGITYGNNNPQIYTVNATLSVIQR